MSTPEFNPPMQPKAVLRAPNQSALPTYLLASGLLFALSPVLYDWALHVVEEPAARYAAMFPLLFLFGLSRTEKIRGRADGYLWLLLAGLVAVICIGGGFTRFGRLAVPLAVIGLCRASGLASFRGACLMLWFVPLPHFVQALAWPEGAVLWFQLGISMLSPLDMRLMVEPPAVAAFGSRILLQPVDSGLSLMVMLSGLAYYASWQKRDGWAKTIMRMSTWSLLGVPLQGLAVVLALLLLYAGQPEWSRMFMDDFIWPTAVMAIWLLLNSHVVERENPAASDPRAVST